MVCQTVDVCIAWRQQGVVTTRAVEIVGARIRKMREDAGFSQEKFAQKIQIDRSYYGRIERGRQNISVSTICTIAGGLGVSPAVLLADLTKSDCSESAHPET